VVAAHPLQLGADNDPRRLLLYRRFVPGAPAGVRARVAVIRRGGPGVAAARTAPRRAAPALDAGPGAAVFARLRPLRRAARPIVRRRAHDALPRRPGANARRLPAAREGEQGGMKALVIGASGHLGAHLTRALLHDGQQVRALVRPGSDTRGLAG